MFYCTWQDAPIKDWVKLAVHRCRENNFPKKSASDGDAHPGAQVDPRTGDQPCDLAAFL